MQHLRHTTATLLAVFLVFGAFAVPQLSQAQSDENQCDTPDFEITSDDQVYALVDEAFSYYIVTANDTSYELRSSLPADLSFSNGQINGTPTTAGESTLNFVATNNCGTTTESVTLTVVSSSEELAEATSGDEGEDGASSGGTDGTGAGSDQSAAANGSVGLDDIPETGFAADTALTVGFYLLALLLLVGWFVRRFIAAPSVVSGDGSYYREVEGEPMEETEPRRFGDGIRR